MPPAIRNLQTAIAQEQQSMAPQQQFIDEQISANASSGAAQEAGLGAQQKTAFGQIEQGAQNKGMFFSGFSPDEQAKYTANTYLPALAQLQATIAGTRSQLVGKKLDLNKGAYDKASALVEQDRNVLNDWNKMTAQQQFQASEADKQRAYDAGQNLQKQNFDANQNAMNRSAAAAQAKSQGAPAGLVDEISSNLDSKRGKDTFVSPETYRANMQKWVKSGGTPDEFNGTYGAYINPVHQATFGGYY